MHPSVPVVKILTKSWGHRKNLGESWGLSFKGSDRGKNVSFSTLAASNIRLLLFYGEVAQ